MNKFNLISYKNENTGTDINFLNYNIAEKVFNYHKSFPQYKKTPLVSLSNLAKQSGLKEFYVKDESYRFGLNAFKVLGGSYCIACYIAEKIGVDIESLTYDKLISSEVKNKIGEITFTTATDGNHGRGIAWTANKIGQKANIFMPKGSSKERLDNILKENATANIYNWNYDECVRQAGKYAKENNGVMVQDTSWEGYEKIPHIFLQAGVGSFAAAITGFFANVMKNNLPIITIVEPNKANCLYKTAKANDGKLHNVDGDLDSIMAGLCCGEPATIGWPILSTYTNFFISVDDTYAAHGMRLLGNTLNEDKKIISGESGAVTSGVVHPLFFYRR